MAGALKESAEHTSDEFITDRGLSWKYPLKVLASIQHPSHELKDAKKKDVTNDRQRPWSLSATSKLKL